jgi:hypothetical protein
VASFLVQIGACKPVPRPVPAPPAEAQPESVPSLQLPRPKQ